MTERDEIGRLLRIHYAEEAATPAPPARLDEILGRTARTRQQASWLARIGGGGFGVGVGVSRQSAPVTVWILVLLAIVLSVLAGAFLIGGGRPSLGLVLVPSSEPSPSASVQDASASPSDTSPSTSLPAPPDRPVPEVASPSPSGAHASPGGTGGPGRLAFVHVPPVPWSPSQSEIYLADADGKNPMLLRSGIDGGADWSPSGRYLLAVNSTPDPLLTLTVLRIDGQTGREVGRIDAGENAGYKWSPAADELAVVTQARTGALISIYRPDGSLIRRLRMPAGVTTVVNGIDWSPDGKRIVIAGCIGCHDNKNDDTPDLIWDLWVVERNGGRPTRLTESPQVLEGSPAWSPDGSVIAYGAAGFCRPTCPPGAVWTIHPDGSDPTMIIAGASNPLWSPDGAHLLYAPAVDVADDIHLWIAAADGTQRVALTTRPGADSALAWSSDGTRVLYVHEDPGDPNSDRPIHIWSIRADGTDPIDLATDVGNAGWRPAP